MPGLRRMTRRAGTRFPPGRARRGERDWAGWVGSTRWTAAQVLGRTRPPLAHWRCGRFAVLIIGRDFTSAILPHLFAIIRGLKLSLPRKMYLERIVTE